MDSKGQRLIAPITQLVTNYDMQVSDLIDFSSCSWDLWLSIALLEPIQSRLFSLFPSRENGRVTNCSGA